MDLLQLLSIIPFYEKDKNIDDITVRTLQIDHRLVEEGDVFICIRGHTVDGHTFAEEAVRKGAVAIVAEEPVNVDVPVIKVLDTSRVLPMLATHFYRYPTDDLQLIGITGTNGKTTITYILEKIYQEFNKKTGVIGTIQVKIGDDSFPVKNTTPDALTLQRTFQRMRDAHVDTAIMEVSSHALQLGRVHGANFDIALFTNLSQDHLDFHTNMDEYFYAKSLLFSQLGNTFNQNEPKFSIINIDDNYGEKLINHSAQPVLTYGIEKDADIRATDIKITMNATSFRLHTPQGTIEVNSPLIGLFNVYNMLAASAVAYASSIDLATIKRSLENISGVDGRFEKVNVDTDYATIVDYAHTPDSLENVLKTVNEFVENDVYVVVGCGGDRDKTKRPLMAEAATKLADYAILTSDNPRTENPEMILSDMTKNLQTENYEVIVDRKLAIEAAVNRATSGDIILIAGKGHETYQEINGERIDFDDREIAKEAMINKENR
ncbi:MAG TPA: UDP-N-acetylmuramoyl-L-alanyl-D-glutamate--2,6-diaminopimelate ligase [Bacillota bacterium]|nr:UDP-N-acetylmuramoyl-L-alanyl-D-glutamate--2,6-diaminopimelate ligase [Bacillota bacterium]